MSASHVLWWHSYSLVLVPGNLPCSFSQDCRNMWRLSLFNTSSKLVHSSVWMRLTSSWHLQQRTVGKRARRWEFKVMFHCTVYTTAQWQAASLKLALLGLHWEVRSKCLHGDRARGMASDSCIRGLGICSVHLASPVLLGYVQGPWVCPPTSEDFMEELDLQRFLMKQCLLNRVHC